ncbi:MAG: response regulator, partial [Nitrospirales bacterium]
MASRVRRPKLRVLVVDEDLGFRTRFCDILGEWHCAALPVASGGEAIEALRRRRVDVVLLALNMSMMDGAETLREIKRLAPGLPVIMTNTLMTPILARRLREDGAQGFLVKPVESQTLAVALLPYV